MSDYFLKESIKLKCSLCYGAGIVVGMARMFWIIWGYKDDDMIRAELNSLKIMNEGKDRLFKIIDKKDELKK